MASWRGTRGWAALLNCVFMHVEIDNITAIGEEYELDLDTNKVVPLKVYVSQKIRFLRRVEVEIPTLCTTEDCGVDSSVD